MTMPDPTPDPALSDARARDAVLSLSWANEPPIDWPDHAWKTLATLLAAPPASDAAASGAGFVERLVSVATPEWSYHEDNHRAPRDFWHVRMNLGELSTDWIRAGRQEKPMTDDEKAKGEDSARDYLRSSLHDAFAAAAPKGASEAAGLREALRASLTKRSIATMDAQWTKAFNAALDMVARDTAAALVVPARDGAGS